MQHSEDGGRIPSIRSQSAPSAGYRWQLVGMLWIVGFLNYADRQAIFSVFPLLQTRLHLSLAELGLLGSSFAWAYGLAAPFAGYFVDRVRRKSAIIGGLEFWSWVCASIALAGKLWSLVLLRSVMGLGESVYFPASLSMMSDYHGPLCANMSETSSPSTITVGRGKKSHFDKHGQDKYFFRCVGSFGA